MYFKLNFVFFVTLCLKYSLADPLEDYKVRYVNNIMECTKDYPITVDDIQKLRNKEIPEGQNVKCLLACAYKKSGMTDDEGKLSFEGMQKLSSELFSDRPDLMRQSEEFSNACKYVNVVDIDGDRKDCERAVMIFKCSAENSVKFNLGT